MVKATPMKVSELQNTGHTESNFRNFQSINDHSYLGKRLAPTLYTIMLVSSTMFTYEECTPLSNLGSMTGGQEKGHGTKVTKAKTQWLKMAVCRYS